MRKAASLILALALCISAFVIPVSAKDEVDIISPRYTNAHNPDVNLTIDSNGLATVKSSCQGVSGTTSIRGITYLQRKVGDSWIRVDIPGALDQWESSVSGRIYSVTKTHQLTIPGTYRAVTIFTVTAGSTETVTVTSETAF
jgi:hypothetical protein